MLPVPSKDPPRHLPRPVPASAAAVAVAAAGAGSVPAVAGEDVRAGVRGIPHQRQRLGAVQRLLRQDTLVLRRPHHVAVLPLPCRQRRGRPDVAGAHGEPDAQGRCLRRMSQPECRHHFRDLRQGWPHVQGIGATDGSSESITTGTWEESLEGYSTVLYYLFSFQLSCNKEVDQFINKIFLFLAAGFAVGCNNEVDQFSCQAGGLTRATLVWIADSQSPYIAVCRSLPASSSY